MVILRGDKWNPNCIERALHELIFNVFTPGLNKRMKAVKLCTSFSQRCFNAVSCSLSVTNTLLVVTLLKIRVIGVCHCMRDVDSFIDNRIDAVNIYWGDRINRRQLHLGNQ